MSFCLVVSGAGGRVRGGPPGLVAAAPAPRAAASRIYKHACLLFSGEAVMLEPYVDSHGRSPCPVPQ